MLGKMVNEFNIGDGICLYGNDGVVDDKESMAKIGSDNEYHDCTYLKVSFNKPQEVGYQYEGGWYGGRDDMVCYGFYERG